MWDQNLQGACHPTAEGRGRKQGDVGKANCSRKRDAGTDRDGPCLVRVLPSPFACPLLPLEGLTPKLRVYRNKTTRPQQGSGGGCAAEYPRDAPQGSAAMNQDLGDLLELLHGDQ